MAWETGLHRPDSLPPQTGCTPGAPAEDQGLAVLYNVADSCSKSPFVLFPVIIKQHAFRLSHRVCPFLGGDTQVLSPKGALYYAPWPGATAIHIYIHGAQVTRLPNIY